MPLPHDFLYRNFLNNGKWINRRNKYRLLATGFVDFAVMRQQDGKRSAPSTEKIADAVCLRQPLPLIPRLLATLGSGPAPQPDTRRDGGAYPRIVEQIALG